MRGLRPIGIALFGGTAAGIWASVESSGLPTIALATAGAATGYGFARSGRASVLGATVALTGVAGARLGGPRPTDGATEFAEILWPVVPLLAVVVWLVALGPGAQSRAAMRQSLSDVWPLWLLLAVGLCSTIWAERPAIALAVGTAWLLILSAGALTQPSPEDIWEGFQAGIWSLLIASNVLESLDPVARADGSVEPSGGTILPFGKLVGFAEDSTEIADVAVLALAVSALAPSRCARWFGAGLALISILRADQRMALLAALVVISLIVRVQRRRRAAGVLVILAVTIAAFSTSILDANDLARRDDGSDVTNLSGRTELWSTVWSDAEEWLWVGRGPGYEEVAAEGFVPFTANVHNRLLAIAVTLGIPGLVAITALAAMLVSRRNRLPMGSAGILGAVAVSGISVPAVGGVGPSPATLAVVALLWVVTVEPQPLNAKPDVFTVAAFD